MNYKYCHGDQIQYDFFGRRKFLNVKGIRWELERMSDHKNMTQIVSFEKLPTGVKNYSQILVREFPP